MKRITIVIGVIICMMAAHLVLAQITEGVIHYEVKVNMHRKLPPDRQAMKEMMPEFNVHQDVLFFRANESMYKTIDREEEPEDEEADGPRMMIRRPKMEIYTNHQLARVIKLQEFFGKKFLIQDTLAVLPWKLEDEQKQILGYTCHRATWYNEERKQHVTAWYTDQLQPFLGPEGLNTLPGTILQLDFNDGERLVTATKVEPRQLKKDEMKIPSGGQRTTPEAFKKMVDDQMKRMGGNGNIIIRN
jgi:GLPGLI family protein